MAETYVESSSQLNDGSKLKTRFRQNRQQATDYSTSVSSYIDLLTSTKTIDSFLDGEDEITLFDAADYEEILASNPYGRASAPHPLHVKRRYSHRQQSLLPKTF